MHDEPKESLRRRLGAFFLVIVRSLYSTTKMVPITAIGRAVTYTQVIR